MFYRLINKENFSLKKVFVLVFVNNSQMLTFCQGHYSTIVSILELTEKGLTFINYLTTGKILLFEMSDDFLIKKKVYFRGKVNLSILI